MTIDIVLPDDVLLEIFDYYVAEAGKYEKWQVLVHVCQKWRYVVFRSPLRLNLRIRPLDLKVWRG
jgi:F-box-like